MISVATGVIVRYSEGVSKKGNSYRLLELGGSDYKKAALGVPENLVDQVKTFPEGASVNVSYSLESGYGGLRADLLSIQKK